VTATGAVYDRGYRPYEGTRGGRTAARWALYRATFRRALGIRRSWRQKLFPWMLLGIVTIPAAVNVGIGYVTRDTPAEGFEFITYRDYVGVSSALLLFIALTAPDVLCPDRRNRVLPLIFARPMTGADYVVAKLGAIVTVLFAFSYIPQVVLFVGQMLVSSDGALDYARENAEVLWQAPLAVAGLALYYTAVGLAISSLTTRRIVAGATILGLMFVSSAVSAILTVDSNGHEASVSSARPGGATNLLALPLYVRDLIFLGHVDPDSPLSGLSYGGALALGSYCAVVAISVVTLFRRYRWVEA